MKIESDNLAIKEDFMLLLLQTHWLPGTRVGIGVGQTLSQVDYNGFLDLKEGFGAGANEGSDSLQERKLDE